MEDSEPSFIQQLTTLTQRCPNVGTPPAMPANIKTTSGQRMLFFGHAVWCAQLTRNFDQRLGWVHRLRRWPNINNTTLGQCVSWVASANAL